MRSQHRAPLVAFAAVTAACLLVLFSAIRPQLPITLPTPSALAAGPVHILQMVDPLRIAHDQPAPVTKAPEPAKTTEQATPVASLHPAAVRHPAAPARTHRHQASTPARHAHHASHPAVTKHHAKSTGTKPTGKGHDKSNGKGGDNGKGNQQAPQPTVTIPGVGTVTVPVVGSLLPGNSGSAPGHNKTSGSASSSAPGHNKVPGTVSSKGNGHAYGHSGDNGSGSQRSGQVLSSLSAQASSVAGSLTSMTTSTLTGAGASSSDAAPHLTGWQRHADASASYGRAPHGNSVSHGSAPHGNSGSHGSGSHGSEFHGNSVSHDSGFHASAPHGNSASHGNSAWGHSHQVSSPWGRGRH